MCSFLIGSALLQYLLFCLQSSDVKDVGYVIVRFSLLLFHSFVDFRRIMTSRITARIISTALVALE